jgi:hypothetical protein
VRPGGGFRDARGGELVLVGELVEQQIGHHAPLNVRL